MIVPIKDRVLAGNLASEALAIIDCPTLPSIGFLGSFTTIAIMDSSNHQATAIFYGFNARTGEVHYIFCSKDKRWGTRANCRDLIRAIFTGTGVRRVSAVCRSDNKKAIKLLHASGFVREGTRREAYGPGLHAVDFGMLRSDAARWLRKAYRTHGKIQRAA